MEGSEHEDDFDDRYIHLIATHSDINKAWGVLYPDSTFKAIWDVTGLIFIIYQSIFIPYRLCFEVDAEGGFYVIETLIDVSFMFDILISFNTGFYKERLPGNETKRNLQTVRQELVFHRLHGFFPL